MMPIGYKGEEKKKHRCAQEISRVCMSNQCKHWVSIILCRYKTTKDKSDQRRREHGALATSVLKKLPMHDVTK